MEGGKKGRREGEREGRKDGGEEEGRKGKREGRREGRKERRREGGVIYRLSLVQFSPPSLNPCSGALHQDSTSTQIARIREGEQGRRLKLNMEKALYYLSLCKSRKQKSAHCVPWEENS